LHVDWKKVVVIQKKGEKTFEKLKKDGVEAIETGLQGVPPDGEKKFPPTSGDRDERQRG